jgi:HK97 family phage portal protein
MTKTGDRGGVWARIRDYAGRMIQPLAAADMEGAAVTSPADLAREMTAGTRSLTGHRITTDSAMRASAVFACVKVIAEDVAAMPLNIYEQLEAGHRFAPEHRVYSVLQNPNEWQTSMEYREMQVMFLLLRGNAYALKATVRGLLDELLPFHPDHVTPRLHPKDGRLVYDVQPRLGGPTVTYEARDIHHVRGLGSNGYTGLSVINYAKNAIGLADAQEGFGAEAFRDGGVNRVALKHPKELSQQAGDRLRNSWVDIYGGPGRYAKPAILEEGLDVVKIGLTAAEMQFLDGRKFQLEDIARFFRVGPHKIGHLDRATNNNVEQMALDHVTSTLLPWCVRLEQRYKKDLLTLPGDARYFARHVVDAHLRGDPLKRWQTHQIATQIGAKSINEVRQQEDMNPIENGDEHYRPLNLGRIGDPEPDPADPNEKKEPVETAAGNTEPMSPGVPEEGA